SARYVVLPIARLLLAGRRTSAGTPGRGLDQPGPEDSIQGCACQGPRPAMRIEALGLMGSDHLMILVTRPAPTVRPPSRIAKRRPSSIAIGWISSTDMSVLSPGMTISVPSGSVTTPVTSVVRK